MLRHGKVIMMYRIQMNPLNKAEMSFAKSHNEKLE